jgi:hypothetical protein
MGDYTAWRRARSYFASRRNCYGMNPRPSLDRVYARHPAPRATTARHRR